MKSIEGMTTWASKELEEQETSLNSQEQSIEKYDRNMKFTKMVKIATFASAAISILAYGYLHWKRAK